MSILSECNDGSMTKKLVSLGFAALFVLTGCSSPASTPATSTSDAPVEEVETLNLDGTWVQTNNDGDIAYHQATIAGDVFTIDWINEEDESRSIYWIGTFPIPETTDDTYAWTSVRDQEATASALLAAQVDSKDFVYENGEIVYEMTALGTTRTIRLERK